MKLPVLFIIGLLVAWVSSLNAQTADVPVGEKYFHDAAKLYIYNKKDSALKVIDSGLKVDPENKKLEALAKKILEENKNQQQQQKQNQDQSQANQDKKQNQQQQNKEEQQKQGEEQQQQQAQQKKQQISKEDAEKILQALNNDEKNTQKKFMKKPSSRIVIEKQW